MKVVNHSKQLIVIVLLWFLIDGISGCGRNNKPVVPGLDVLVQENLELIQEKRVGIVTNHTALSADGKHIGDVLKKLPSVNITSFFAPEHGIRGNRAGGEYIETYKDSITGITVYSLYHKHKKPTSAMLDSVDILLFDIQDIGTRFYTYISTMGLAMEAAAQKGIPFVILDRPNPITGAIVEGPVLQPEYKSFIGMYPIPIRHGMTVGELGRMINEEGWLKNGIRADLTVIPVKNWKRLQWYDETGLPWVKTSPNMPTVKTATLYPGMGLLEGANISEGRGTNQPFIKIGAPWFEPERIKKEISTAWIYGIEMEPIQFTPVAIPNVAPYPDYEGQLCQGFQLELHDRNVFRAVSFSIQLLCAVQKLYPDKLELSGGFNRLAGNNNVRKEIKNGTPAKDIIAHWKRKLNEFKRIRKKYLLYE